MTNKEAIEILNNWSPWQEIGDYDRFRDALDMAIKSLEQQPSEDCISRQAAINALGECPMVWTDSDAEITAERDWRDTVKMLKRLPSVTPSYNLEPYSERLWKNAYERGKADVLDKISAEIEHLHDWAFSREEILRIIDKYRVESEDVE